MSINIIDSIIFQNDYDAKEIRDIFDEVNVVESWLLFEATLAEVQADLGIIPKEAAEEISSKATLDHVKMDRIAEIYSKTKLASVAMIRALVEVCKGDAGEYIHYGSCTPELFENTLAYRIKQAMEIYEKDLLKFQRTLNQLARKHSETIMVDRSHGQQALPTTFGFIAATWSDEISRHIERLRESRKRILMGTIKGAVGNYSSHYAISGDKCLKMEKMVLDRLGLEFNPIDFRRHLERLGELMTLFTLLAMSFEKIADDVITQQRNEIGELEEPFDSLSQVGSSTMPQKRNPVRLEAIIAWCRKIRSNANAFTETHMKEAHDITGFYMEDLIIPETCVLVKLVLDNANFIFENLVVNPEAMKRNLEYSNGLIMTEALMIALTKKTGKKETAHHIIHAAAMEAYKKGVAFNEHVLRFQDIKDYFTQEELNKILDPANYLGLNERCINSVLDKNSD
jgi:adenylosuccinate lyase